jgi:hypothetical protein
MLACITFKFATRVLFAHAGPRNDRINRRDLVDAVASARILRRSIAHELVEPADLFSCH